MPGSLSAATLCGPNSLPGPERARPRPPALPAAAARGRGVRRAAGALSCLRGAAEAWGERGEAARVAARARGLAPGRRSVPERPLAGGPAGSKRLTAFGTSLFLPLCPVLARAFAGPSCPERARRNILSRFPYRVPLRAGDASGCPAKIEVAWPRGWVSSEATPG